VGTRAFGGGAPLPGPREHSAAEGETGRFPNEGPVHQVCVDRFELAKFDVTQWDWRQVVIWPNQGDYDPFYKGDRRPVESASWDDAQRFLWWMSLFGRHHYRLPSEAEWEYAARAGTTTPYFWGEHIEEGCAYARVADLTMKQLTANALSIDCHYPAVLESNGISLFEIAGTGNVDSLKPNPWGLHDMLGNVFQWVADCYADKYDDAHRDGNAVTTEDCESHVARGGSFDINPRVVRAAYRTDGTPVYRFDWIGFRAAKSATP